MSQREIGTHRLQNFSRNSEISLGIFFFFSLRFEAFSRLSSLPLTNLGQI
jgi:hypothetical protein